MYLKQPLAVQLALAMRSGNLRAFACRGRFQVSLDPTAFVVSAAGARNVLGVTLLPTMTPRQSVTMVSVGRAARLQLDGATIGRGVSLAVGPNAQLRIGRDTYITDGTRIAASRSVTIGERGAISWGVTIIDDDGHGKGTGPFTAEITIGDHVWIGCNVTILKGVSVGSDSIVAAGAVVTRSCSPGSLIAGNPARTVKSGVSW